MHGCSHNIYGSNHDLREHMSRPSHDVERSPTPPSSLSVPTRPITLRDVIKDCGGVSDVAPRLGVSAPSIYGWVSQGHLPLSDLQGRTNYSETLASMQREGKLSAAEIRRIGLRL